MNNTGSVEEWIKVNQLCITQVDGIRTFIGEYTRKYSGNRKRIMLISILLRFSVNLISVALLAKSMVVNKMSLNLKLSVGILLRNCYMDALLGLYLCDKDERHIDEIAEVLNLDYVKALFDQFEVYRDKLVGTGWDDDFLEHLYTMGIEDTYWDYLKYKGVKTEIVPGKERYIWGVTPKNEIRTLIPKGDVKNELNISTICSSLKNVDIYAGCADNLYAYYKYFSQYEHFSEAGYGNTIVSSEDDNVDMVKAIERLAESVDLIKRTGLL